MISHHRKHRAAFFCAGCADPSPSLRRAPHTPAGRRRPPRSSAAPLAAPAPARSPVPRPLIRVHHPSNITPPPSPPPPAHLHTRPSCFDEAEPAAPRGRGVGEVGEQVRLPASPPSAPQPAAEKARGQASRRGALPVSRRSARASASSAARRPCGVFVRVCVGGKVACMLRGARDGRVCGVRGWRAGGVCVWSGGWLCVCGHGVGRRLCCGCVVRACVREGHRGLVWSLVQMRCSVFFACLRWRSAPPAPRRRSPGSPPCTPFVIAQS